MTQATQSWVAKDPDARQDYLYTIPLDPADVVASYTLTQVSGTATIDTHSRSGADVTAWISGGADGETDLFKIAWVTVAGREDEAFLTLPIVSGAPTELLLTGYAKPSAAHLAMRYPEFADVAPATIAYWLTDAERQVTTSWIEGDYAGGLMALAAHNLALSGLGANGERDADIPAGVTAMKSADISLNFDAQTVRDKVAGGLSATRYGIEFKRLRRISGGGPRVMGTGTIPYDDWARYPQGEG